MAFPPKRELRSKNISKKTLNALELFFRCADRVEPTTQRPPPPVRLTVRPPDPRSDAVVPIRRASRRGSEDSSA